MERHPDRAPKLRQEAGAEARRYARKCGLAPQEAERMLLRAARKSAPRKSKDGSARNARRPARPRADP